MPETHAVRQPSERTPLGGVNDQQSSPSAADQARVGFWNDIVGSFTNGLQAQENGIVQLSNKVLGTAFQEGKLAAVDNPDSSWSAWTASLVGQAGLMAFELSVGRKLGALSKLCAGRGSSAELFAAAQTPQSKMSHSLLFGAGLGGIATPTDDAEHFWRDRIFNTFSSTATMGSMTAVSLKMELAAAKLTGSAASVFGNAYFNNAAGGLVGGSLGELASQTLYQQPFDWQRIGRAGLEFGIVGAGAHAINIGGAAAYGKLSAEKASAPKDAESPQKPKESSEKPNEAPDVPLRFALSPDAAPLVEKVVEKFKLETVSAVELEAIIKQFPTDKQPLAVRILEHSLPNSSEVWFADRMKTLKSRLDPLRSAESNGNYYFGEQGASVSQALGYLYRKYSHDGTIYLNAVHGNPAGHVGILLDVREPASYTKHELKLFNSLERIVVLDFNGFETGVNFLDYAMGPQQVTKKLAGMMEGVERARQEHPGETEDQLIKRVLKGPLSDLAARLHPKFDIVSADDVPLKGSYLKSTDVGDLPAAASRISSTINSSFATPERVTDYLTRHVPLNQAPLAQMMAEGTSRVTWKDLADNARALHGRLLEQINKEAPGSGWEDISFFDSNVAKSGSLVNYLYRQVNDVPRERFGVYPPAKNLVFLDDKIYSGQQMGKEMGHFGHYQSVERMFGATLIAGGYPMVPYSNPVNVPVFTIGGGREPATGTVPNWPGATAEQTARLRRLESEAGVSIAPDHNDLLMGEDARTITYHERIVLPYGVPDNDIPSIREFSHRVLGSESHNGSDGKPLTAELARHVGERTNNIAPGKDLIELGEVTVGRVGFDTNAHDAVVQLGERKVHADVWPDPYGSYETAFDRGNKLSLLLNLTSYHPLGKARNIDGKKYWVQERPADMVPQAEVQNILKGLSGHKIDEFSPDQYKVVRTDPEIRQQLESAYLEQLLLGQDPLRISARLYPDGRMLVTSRWLDGTISESKKPSWGSGPTALESEFSGHQISNQNYSAVRNFYQRYLAEPTGVDQLRTLGLSTDQTNGLMSRAEWFLEQRRFPSY
jgi:hypothetical protein